MHAKASDADTRTDHTEEQHDPEEVVEIVLELTGATLQYFDDIVADVEQGEHYDRTEDRDAIGQFELMQGGEEVHGSPDLSDEVTNGTDR